MRFQKAVALFGICGSVFNAGLSGAEIVGTFLVVVVADKAVAVRELSQTDNRAIDHWRFSNTAPPNGFPVNADLAVLLELLKGDYLVLEHTRRELR